MDFEHCIQEIKKRRWSKIRTSWLDYIPTIAPPGRPPPLPLAEFTDLRRIASDFISEAKLGGTAGQGFVYEEVEGLRQSIFWESLYLLHKARHVLGAAELHAAEGLRTWSLSSAYQGAMFAARGLTGLLGVAFATVENKTILIDLFPGPIKETADYVDAGFFFIPERLEHRPLWTIFQRVLRVTIVEFWPPDLVNKLKIIEVENFAKQRNAIHYKPDAWIFDDLHQFDLSDGFGSIQHWGQSNLDLEFSRKDISLVFCFCLTRLGIMLLQDIASLSKKISGELALFETCVEEGHHPVYQRDLVEIGAI